MTLSKARRVAQTLRELRGRGVLTLANQGPYSYETERRAAYKLAENYFDAYRELPETLLSVEVREDWRGVDLLTRRAQRKALREGRVRTAGQWGSLWAFPPDGKRISLYLSGLPWVPSWEGLS